MDKKSKDFNNVKNSSISKPLVSGDPEKMESNGEVQEDKETVSLLPSRRGGLSKKAGRPRLKVQWNDKDGNKLAEIVEYQPSDTSDSDDEDSDSCMCVIM
ncbi:GTPase [Actinidia chinensis var. chinensis]|uniref:GTPase n=1 Tax=Actinidia chinensis var. chinensis TaxID=1590841 RepID=A0A2R6PW25_ACTCC|nr:GTPase [Actinidia chinensis var. chinensis]